MSEKKKHLLYIFKKSSLFGLLSNVRRVSWELISQKIIQIGESNGCF